MSARLGFRAIRANPFTRPTTQSNMRFAQRRTYASAAEDAGIAQPKQSGFSAFMNSKVGPKTVHFWAPIMKWGLVLAGASDFARPADQLSLTQNAALMCTGLIWTRWCFVIRPQNLFLASVNFLLFCVGATQTGRVLSYQASQKGTTVEGAVESELKRDAKAVENFVEDPKGAVKNVTNPK